MEIKIRDLRKKEKFFIDDEYLNGYARLCGVYSTAVYNSLSRHANFHTQEAFPSIEKIAEQHNISKPSVIKAIKKLEEWNIISIKKEKDAITKKQCINTYVLLDRSKWTKKEESRVNDVDSENTKAESISEQKPSQSQNKSRVNDVDCNVYKELRITKIKDNKEKCEQARGINYFIDLFKNVNPSFGKLFGNKTQRGATERLLQKYGGEKLEMMIISLEEVNTKKYAPVITTPVQLEEKLGQLVIFINKEHQNDTIAFIS